jgi:hypothetical protein
MESLPTIKVNGETAHSLYTTNDRGVNEVVPEKSLAASWFVRTKDLFIEPLQLTRIGSRRAINAILSDRDVDSTTFITYVLRSAIRLTGCVRK